MILYTNDGDKYKVKWVEYWNETDRKIIAEGIDGEVYEIPLENFNKVEETKGD